MLDVGWSEMLVIAIVMIVVVGPKDLPQMLRTFGRVMAKMRGMANDFQKQFNDALKEAELEDVKKSVDSLRSLNPAAQIRKQLNPFEKAAADVRSGLDNAMKPKPAETAAPAVTEAKPDEPLKSGVDVPGGPEAMPIPPTFPAMTDASASASVVASEPAAKPARKVAGAKTSTSTPAKPAPAKPAPAKPTPTKTAPGKTASVKAESVKAAPIKASPAKAAPAKVGSAKAAAAKPGTPAAGKTGSASKPAAGVSAVKAAKPAASKPASAKVTAKSAQPARKPARAPK